MSWDEVDIAKLLEKERREEKRKEVERKKFNIIDFLSIGVLVYALISQIFK